MSSWVVIGKDGNALAGFPDKVVSINATDGTVAWEFLLSASTVSSCRVAEDGTIYVCADNKVVALSPRGNKSGLMMWEALLMIPRFPRTERFT